MNSTQPNPARILIADDNGESRAILSACLQDEGYRVETAIDADEALAKGIALRPDLFLLDVWMPRKNGFELCRELRSTPVLKHSPILLITGLDSQADRLQGIDSGCDDFLAKPVQRADLLTRVQTLLRVHALRSQFDERRIFEAVLLHLSDGILVLDPQGHIVTLNQSAARLLNLDMDEVRGQHLLDWVCRVFRVSVPRGLIERPAERTLRFEVSRPEQTGNAALFLAVTVDVIAREPDRVAGTVWTVRDVTRAKKEARLHHTFLSLISHKLRTPIAGITEHASLLQDELLGALSPGQRHSVERVREQTARLNEFVDKVLGYIQVDEAQWDHAGDAFALSGAIRAAVGRVVARYHGKEVQVKYTVGEGLYGMGISEAHFGLVIENLVDNAVKFCDKPVAEVTLGHRKTSDGQHELYVGDNGPGIPHEEFDSVFEEFYQIDQFFTGNVAGVGLGLSLVRRLIEMMGGKVWITSELGHGATFHFILPVAGFVTQKPPDG